MIIYVASFINKSSNINGNFVSNKDIFWRLIKGDDIMLPILAIEVGTVVVGKVIAHGIVKWIKD